MQLLFNQSNQIDYQFSLLDAQDAEMADADLQHSQHGDINIAEERKDRPSPLYLTSSQDTDGIEETESLFFTLKLLFALNGLSLSLQYIPIMFIINTQVTLPIEYLPTYGSIAFLPYSFKPLYAFLSRQFHRPTLIAILLTINATFILVTSILPKGAVVSCFLIAFARAVTDSWAEFCVGLCLIDQASQRKHTFERSASSFQSEAATARNIGSLGANIITFAYFLHRQLNSSEETQINRPAAMFLLVLTASCNLIGAAFMMIRPPTYLSNPAQASDEHSTTIIIPQTAMEDISEETGLRDYHSESSYSSHDSIEEADDHDATPSRRPETKQKWDLLSGNLVMVVLLQTIVIIFAMKGPIMAVAATWIWKSMIGACMIAIISTALYMSSMEKWTSKLHGTSLFLILRHAVPSDGMLMGSFMYTVFMGAPVYLQLLSMMGTCGRTLSSWSYGALLSKYNSGRALRKVIAFTTIVASVSMLSNIPLVRRIQEVGTEQDALFSIFLFAVGIRILISFTDEWAFLPDVILATSSVNVGQNSDSRAMNGDIPTQDVDDAPSNESDRGGNTQSESNAGVEYGTFISCIDFGDQLGSLLAVPLVSFLGISRDNGWEHYDSMIMICAMFSIISISFMGVLPKTG